MQAFAEEFEGFGRCDTGPWIRDWAPLKNTLSSGAHSTVDPKVFEVVTMVRRPALKKDSAALSQLASRISAVMKFGAGAGEEPFAKMKKLTTDSIDRLQAEVSSEASHKSYCYDELAKASEKRADLETQVAAHSSN